MSRYVLWALGGVTVVGLFWPTTIQADSNPLAHISVDAVEISPQRVQGDVPFMLRASISNEGNLAVDGLVVSPVIAYSPADPDQSPRWTILSRSHNHFSLAAGASQDVTVPFSSSAYGIRQFGVIVTQPGISQAKTVALCDCWLTHGPESKSAVVLRWLPWFFFACLVFGISVVVRRRSAILQRATRIQLSLGELLVALLAFSITWVSLELPQLITWTSSILSQGDIKYWFLWVMIPIRIGGPLIAVGLLANGRISVMVAISCIALPYVLANWYLISAADSATFVAQLMPAGALMICVAWSQATRNHRLAIQALVLGPVLVYLSIEQPLLRIYMNMVASG